MQRNLTVQIRELMTRNHLRNQVSLRGNHKPNQNRQRDTMSEDMPQYCILLSMLVRRYTRNNNRLSVNHLPHNATRAIRCCC